MPAKSKSQQRLFGMVHAYQKGKLDKPSKEIKKIAKSISKKDAKDFAETKHKGLPNKKKKKKVSESMLHNIIKETINEVMANNNSKEKIINKFLPLIQQINNEYSSLKKEYGEPCLMNKKGECYYLAELQLYNNGYVIIKLQNSYEKWRNETDDYKIKIFTKSNGKYILYKDEFRDDYDYRDALKLLKQLINDLNRYKQDMEGYDPNWEDGSKEGEKNRRAFNKKIGVNRDPIYDSKINKIINETIKKYLK